MGDGHADDAPEQLASIRHTTGASMARLEYGDDCTPEGVRRALTPRHFLEREKFWRRAAYVRGSPFRVFALDKSGCAAGSTNGATGGCTDGTSGGSVDGTSGSSTTATSGGSGSRARHFGQPGICTVAVSGNEEEGDGLLAASEAGGRIFDRLAAEKLRREGTTAALEGQPAAAREGRPAAATHEPGTGGDPAGVLIGASEFAACFLTPAEAGEAFALFDLDGSGALAREEFVNTFKVMLTSWEAAQKALSTFGSVTAALEISGNIAYIVAAVVLALVVFDIEFRDVWLPLLSTLLPLSFAFAPTLQRVMDNLYLLLLMAPYDVGDNVSIEGQPGICMGNTVTVKRVTFTHTLFEDGTGRQVMVANHRILAGMSVFNLTRSGSASASPTFVVTHAVTEVQLAALQARIAAYVLTRPLEWKPSFSLAFDLSPKLSQRTPDQRLPRAFTVSGSCPPLQFVE